MSKGWRRTWIKIFVTGWLHGSIRWQLEADERGVWADLIALAGECGQEGAIIDNDKKPYPRSFIASQFNIKQELLDRTIAKCRADGRIDDRDDQIIITNWKAYQSEYARQKPYRQGKEGQTVRSFKECPACHYLIEISKLTERMEICPQCSKKGKEVKLIPQKKSPEIA